MAVSRCLCLNAVLLLGLQATPVWGQPQPDGQVRSPLVGIALAAYVLPAVRS